MRIVLRDLRWEHLDPGSHPFDPAAAREIAERIVVPAAAALPSARDRVHTHPVQTRCERDLTLALLRHYGPWIAGWTWAASEPGGGGPVRGWCCDRDSVLPEGESAGATIERVVGAVGEWRGFLEELARMQAAIREETAALPKEDAIELTAARYVPFVVERTRTEDAWYGTFRKVLVWHLQALGHDDIRIQQVVASVTSGRFQSWVEPSAVVAGDVCAELGLRVAEVIETPRATSDGLAQWLELRGRAGWKDPSPHFEAVTVDGHRTFIDKHDRARSAERAERMLEALSLVRENGREPLTWALLCAAQRRVLGQNEVDFRRGEAFAKGGRERYGFAADTRARFESCLSEANDLTTPAHVRAARVYLDICFFHPFPDGNARAARLALDHVLTRAGFTLGAAEPVFLFPCRADDSRITSHFMYLIEQLSGPLHPGPPALGEA